MTEIRPKYEVLYSDLRNHQIGNYLASREFKLFMSSIDEFDTWKKTYEKVKDSRSYISLGTNHEPGDASNTLVIYFNEIERNKSFEYLISRIIAKFIENYKEKTDFSDIYESIISAKFDNNNILLIESAIEIYSNKGIPQKVINKPSKAKTRTTKENQIFIVHGHNEEIKHNVARTIEKLNLNPIILNEQSNEGLTIIEKFEKYSDVSFAIVLLTFDDFGNTKSKEPQNKRARQNVILELGYFIAKLGRKNVMPLYENDVELPSDISGILYTKIDESENWKFRLVKELNAAGFKVDANDIL